MDVEHEINCETILLVKVLSTRSIAQMKMFSRETFLTGWGSGKSS